MKISLSLQMIMCCIFHQIDSGLGGFDVYSANLDTDKKTVNLGMPINSGKDDFSFYIDKENKLGYLSSNRLGKDNIYATSAICKAQILTIAKNSKTGDLISGAKVVVMDNNKSIVSTQFSNDQGVFLYDGECNKIFCCGL
jgi:hypothetical protein